MLPIDPLLCPVPEIQSAAAALHQAAHLACAADATLHVLPGSAATRDAVPDALRTALPADRHAALDVTVAEPLTANDGTVEATRAYAKAAGIALVVTDTPPDRGPIPPLAAPAVQALVERIDCSVFVVARRRPLPAPRRILVPTDLSASAQTALTHATALAARGDPAVDLLHVIEAVPYVALTRMDRLSLSSTSFPERRARRRLAAVLDAAPAPNVPIEVHLEYGDPADQIGRVVNRLGTDLMVLSSRSPGKGGGLGPVADRVLRRVTCPLLLVRPDPDAADA
jgi:nucleotide-binding universal stress UspA family protein